MLLPPSFAFLWVVIKYYLIDVPEKCRYLTMSSTGRPRVSAGDELRFGRAS